jgi:hypothetical protein
MYDEIWVAGPAGRERYAYLAAGVPDRRIREIGPVRPLATAPLPAVVGNRPVVLYAPAWENAYDSTDLSSLVERGSAVLEALLARQDVRVLFAPAAPTGSRLPEYADAVAALTRRVAAAGFEHAVLEPEQIPAALAAASFAVLDVSPLISEAVRLDVPFAAPALRGHDAAAMVERFPTLSAGAVLEDLPEDVFLALDDALGDDRRAGARAAMRAHLDGEEPQELPRRFAAAVTDAFEAQRRRRAFARPS